MKPIKVLSVGPEKEVGSNGTRICKVELLTLDLKETLNVTCFLGKDGTPADIKVGSDYEAELEEGKPYKGCKQYSMAIWKMKEMPKVDPEKELADEEKEMWDQKEMRSHRRACLAIAASMLSDDMKKQGSPDVEVVGMVQLIASQLVDYVYETPDVPIPPEE